MSSLIAQTNKQIPVPPIEPFVVVDVDGVVEVVVVVAFFVVVVVVDDVSGHDLQMHDSFFSISFVH